MEDIPWISHCEGVGVAVVGRLVVVAGVGTEELEVTGIEVLGEFVVLGVVRLNAVDVEGVVVGKILGVVVDTTMEKNELVLDIDVNDEVLSKANTGVVDLVLQRRFA
jgi:hypothetical protein